MNKPMMAMLAAGFLAALSPGTRAQDLQVMADSVFQPALKELAPLFAERTGTQVRLSLAPSAILAERLLAGESADVFFPAGDRHLRQALEKGLVDVTLKRNILVLPEPETPDGDANAEPAYAAAAVMAQSAQRVQAMAFLEFLASDAARGVFARQGFGLP